MPNKWSTRNYERRVSNLFEFWINLFRIPQKSILIHNSVFIIYTSYIWLCLFIQDSSPIAMPLAMPIERDRPRNQRERNSYLLDHRIFSPNDSFSIVDFDWHSNHIIWQRIFVKLSSNRKQQMNQIFNPRTPKQCANELSTNLMMLIFLIHIYHCFVVFIFQSILEMPDESMHSNTIIMMVIWYRTKTNENMLEIW